MTTPVIPSPRKKQKLSNTDPSSTHCLICHTPAPKYRCPRCLRSTCSLPCIKQHKLQFECDGQVERTKYKPLNQLHDSDIIKDYSLLQDVAHTIDGSRRHPILNVLNKSVQNKRSVGINNRVSALPKDDNNESADPAASKSSTPDAIRQHLPAGLSTAYSTYAPRFRHLALVAEAHQCTLLLLPSGMQLHQRNSSTADQQAQTIQWRIELQCSALAKPLVRTKVNDETTWRELLSQTLGMQVDRPTVTPSDATDTAPQSSEAAEVPESTTTNTKLKRQRTAHTVSPVLKHRLRQYIEAGIDALHFFLPVPLQPANAQRWYKLDIDHTIRQSLQNKTLIEFPVVHVALNDEAARYNTSPPLKLHAASVDCTLEDGELSSSSSDSDSDSDSAASDVDDDVKAAALAEFDALIGGG